MLHTNTASIHSVAERFVLDRLRGRLNRGFKPLLNATLLALTCTLTSGLSAQTLESKSPFLPPGHNAPRPEAPKPVQVNGPISREIEFRGVVQMNGVYQFSVFNKSEQKGYWIRENESKDGIGIRSFDADSMSITVNQNGRSERLSLMESTDSPLPVAISTPPATNSGQANKPVLPPGLENLTNNSGNSSRPSRVVPRRRVILPRK